VKKGPLVTILPGLLLVAGLLLTTCSPTLSPTGEESPLSTPGGQEVEPRATLPPTSNPTAVPPGVPAEAQQVLDLVKQDLAQRLNVPVDAVTVVSVEAVKWPDASLGCPQPGKN